MSAETIACLNYVVHSLVIGAAAWLLVRFVIRDALRRCILANLAVLMCLYTPFNIGMQDLMPKPKEEVPVWTPIRETLKADWRVSVAPVSATVVNVAPEARRWDVNGGVSVLRWFAWGVAAALLMRLLYQSVRVQMWAWGLREPTQSEMSGLPEGVPYERISVFEGEGTPCVAGWFFPVIAVPASAFEALTHREWRWLLRHEAEHLRLHDTVVVLLQSIVRACLWWNPFAHALAEEYTRAREEMCDAAAVGGEREPMAYADFLLAWAAKPGPQQACVMPIAYSRPARRLKARLVALMEARGVRKKLGALFVLGLAAFIFIAPLIAASFGIATAGAQEPGKGVKAQADGGAMHTRAYRVAPDFLNAGVVPADPFAGGKAAPAPAALVKKTARELLEGEGVRFPPGASAIFNPATSQLIVRHHKAALDQIEAIVDRRNKRLPQVYVQCKLIQADNHFGTHGGLLKADEVAALWQGILQNKSIGVATLPSVTMKLGVGASIEMVREVLPENKGESVLKWVGPSIKLNVNSAANGKALVAARVDLGVDPDGAHPWLSQKGEKPDWNRVQIYTSGAQAELASGETLVMHLQTAKKAVTVLITAEALSPNGQKAINFESTATALPSSTGNDLPDKAANEWGQRVYRVPEGFPNDKPPMEVFQAAGISFEKNASAMLRDGKLIVRNTKPNLELIEVLLAHLPVAAVKKRVLVFVKAVEMKGDLWELMKEWVPPLPGAPRPAVVTDPTLLLPAASRPPEILQMFVTAGILAPSQFETVMKKIARSPVKLEVLRPDGKSKKHKLPDTMGGLEATVESTIGGDGNTIELIITVDGANRRSSTGVTIWDGQTVVLGAQPSDDLTRFLFITAQMVEEEKKK